MRNIENHPFIQAIDKGRRIVFGPTLPQLTTDRELNTHLLNQYSLEHVARTFGWMMEVFAASGIGSQNEQLTNPAVVGIGIGFTLAIASLVRASRALIISKQLDPGPF